MDAEVREAIAAQTLALKESASGVNLDEEMVALAKYQRAYQAASRVMTTADSLLEELMNSIGR
jgi:flagellar hook-associated protein 1 FlgK